MPSRYLTAAELAAHLNVTVSFVREMTRSRTEDPLPHIYLGKYRRYVLGPQLEQWIAHRTRGGQQ